MNPTIVALIPFVGIFGLCVAANGLFVLADRVRTRALQVKA